MTVTVVMVMMMMIIRVMKRIYIVMIHDVADCFQRRELLNRYGV